MLPLVILILLIKKIRNGINIRINIRSFLTRSFGTCCHAIVCKSKMIQLFDIIKDKTYWSCQNCNAKFLDKKDYVDLKTEKKHYLKHNNFIKDAGYRQFLSRLIIPLKEKISVNDVGLDYGCGYGPALVDMLKGDGYKIECYDPFFFPNKDIF